MYAWLFLKFRCVRPGGALVLPHPERRSPENAPLKRDDAIERIAVETVMAYERARGWRVQSVETEDRGFDLISRKPHPEDPANTGCMWFLTVRPLLKSIWFVTPPVWIGNQLPK